MPDDNRQTKSSSAEELRHRALAASRLCPVHHTRRAARAITALYDRELAPFKVTSPQLTMLSAISSARRAKPEFLCRVLMMDKSTVSRNLRVLEREQLVSREADGKRTILKLTEEGEARTNAALDHWRLLTERMTATLPAGRFAQLVEDLEHLASCAARDADSEQ